MFRGEELIIDIKDFKVSELTRVIGWSFGDHDPRSKGIKRLDPDKIELIATAKLDETITGLTRRNRLDLKKYVLLGPNVFGAFNACRKNIPDSWKNPGPGGVVQPIVFDGATLENPCTSGGAWVLGFRYENGMWIHRDVSVMECDTRACRSAVLPVECL